jgi:hypothetical protein
MIGIRSNVQKALALELRMGEPIELPSKRAVNLARIFDELDLGVERIEAANRGGVSRSHRALASGRGIRRQ